MSDRDLVLTSAERTLIDQSVDRRTPRRRVMVSLVTSALLAVLLIAATFYLGWPLPLVLAFLAYIAFTSYERWTHGRAVVLYRSVVSKLWRYIRARETFGSDPPGGAFQE